MLRYLRCLFVVLFCDFGYCLAWTGLFSFFGVCITWLIGVWLDLVLCYLVLCFVLNWSLLYIKAVFGCYLICCTLEIIFCSLFDRRIGGLIWFALQMVTWLCGFMGFSVRLSCWAFWFCFIGGYFDLWYFGVLSITLAGWLDLQVWFLWVLFCVIIFENAMRGFRVFVWVLGGVCPYI